jgi:hypothetical protein
VDGLAPGFYTSPVFGKFKNPMQFGFRAGGDYRGEASLSRPVLLEIDALVFQGTADTLLQGRLFYHTKVKDHFL